MSQSYYYCKTLNALKLKNQLPRKFVKLKFEVVMGMFWQLCILTSFLAWKLVSSEEIRPSGPILGMDELVDQDPNLVDLKSCKVWGPGLRPHVIVLPARYFFVHLKGHKGVVINATESIREALKVRIDCDGDRSIWTQLLDRKDGSFIIRYKLYQSCMKNFRIIITFHKQHVGNSPYKFHVPIHPDHCNCPRYVVENWVKKVKCPESNSQISDDLKFFPEIDFKTALDTSIKKLYNPGAVSFCHYTVKDNRVFRKCYGQHVGFHIFADSVLLSLTRKMYMPDFQFLMNLGDWPLIERSRFRNPIPMFSWCKSNVTYDIVLPTYEITEASLEAMGRVSLDMMSIQSNIDLPWNEKFSQLFWRGRDSRRERLDLIDIARKHPDLFNVSLTNFFFFRDQEKIYGPKAPHVPFFKFFDYKYQLNIDGTVAAYRFPFLLAGDSVVFKTDSAYIEHFYREVKPWQHYIPVAADLSDLVTRINWALANDKKAKIIAETGTEYARMSLMPLNIMCYHAIAFKEYASRLKGDVEVSEGMEEVTLKLDSTKGDCNCLPRRRNYESDDGTDDRDEL